MSAGASLPILGQVSSTAMHQWEGPVPKITSLLIKPASAVCNLDCTYCFYLDREADPYKELPARRMSNDTLERLVDTWLFYSHPNAAFAFQGGEPTLAGLPFFRKLVRLQEQYGRSGMQVSNSMQTNAVLLDDAWAELFAAYNFLLGVSLDGPEELHDKYRVNKGGAKTWRKVMDAIQVLQRHKVEFNILCVLSQANVHQPRELYRWFRKQGFEYMQFIPLAEFRGDGSAYEFNVSAAEYGHFLTEVFDEWWPERRKVRVRFFDNLAEAVAGHKPGACTLHDSCDSYAVVEYNGDVYPCDFFVENHWKLGNIELDSWAEIARRARRYHFSQKKQVPHAECQVCAYRDICHGGCPKYRHVARQSFDDLDYFCPSYKAIFAKAVEPLAEDVRKLMAGRR